MNGRPGVPACRCGTPHCSCGVACKCHPEGRLPVVRDNRQREADPFAAWRPQTRRGQKGRVKR